MKMRFPIYDQSINEEIGGDMEEEKSLALMLKKHYSHPSKIVKIGCALIFSTPLAILGFEFAT